MYHYISRNMETWCLLPSSVQPVDIMCSNAYSGTVQLKVLLTYFYVFSIFLPFSVNLLYTVFGRFFTPMWSEAPQY